MPTGCDTPTASAAFSLVIPVAICFQNCRSVSRRSDGAPGERIDTGAQAVLALREYAWWKAAQALPEQASERRYQALQRRLRQWEAVLTAHAIPVRTMTLRDETDVLQAARRH